MQQGGRSGGFLADQLTLSQPEGADCAHHINTVTPGFSYLPTALSHVMQLLVKSWQFSSEIIRKIYFNI